MGGDSLDANNGKTYFIVFGQWLWFGDQMRKFIINPSRCWAFGVIICDYPTNNYRSIGINMGNVFFRSILKAPHVTQ